MFVLQDEVVALQGGSDQYEIPNERDLATEDPAELLEFAVEAIADDSASISQPDVFDICRSLLKQPQAVPGPVMSKLLDSITSGMLAQVEATENDDPTNAPYHREALEMYAFLLQWFVEAVGKVKPINSEEPLAKPKKGRGGKTSKAAKAAENWSWNDQIPATLQLISRVLKLPSSRIWTTSVERDTFINCITRPAYHIAESPDSHLRLAANRTLFYTVLSIAVTSHSHAHSAQTNIIQSLQYYEHLAEPLAEFLAHLASPPYNHGLLADEVLREISGMHFKASDTKTPKSFGRFLVRFTELAPRNVLKQISLLLPLLDSEAYTMRQSIVEVLGFLIRELTTNAVGDPTKAGGEGEGEDPTTTAKTLTNLWSLLRSRRLDVTYFVRIRVLNVLTGLVKDLPAKFPAQRLKITKAAVEMLEDKASGVRKGAVGLLVELVGTHPYGMHFGGQLVERDWEGMYQQVKKELAGIEGVVGDAVATQVGEEEEEAEGSKKKKEKKAREEDEMDVDGGDTDVDEDEEEEEEDDDEMDQDEDETMPLYASDEEDPTATPKPKPKKKGKKSGRKLGPRKSTLSMPAIQSETLALANLSQTELIHLRLRKKYYVEALNFIRHIESCMEVMVRLLGSLNKGEVLEAMEFFRVCKEYGFESAETGIKEMLHLIWVKDNNDKTPEEGAPENLKGVRSKLLETYRMMYFDRVGQEDAKTQVNRVAKNMTEMTYEANLAQLTSLEEMLRSMKADHQISFEVTNKLWQVYSSDRPLPKAQRRAAILILGMLALADRSVVTDHVDTLLRIGFVKYGKADLVLARFTCVALQRLNGSAKKVKGSLVDKTLRLSMESPVFRRLQESVENPTRSKAWFGLAEQAINTIYALAEHPDVLCGTIIKNLTIRAFAPQGKGGAESGGAGTPRAKGKKGGDAVDQDEDQEDDPDASMRSDDTATQEAPHPTQEDGADDSDTGNAFELSQLLFVVGHVAIKQIVFLELVEREMKRQKDAEKKESDARTKGPARDDDIDLVSGNVEDEVGEHIADVREKELLFGNESLLAIYGPMLVHICGSPHKFKNATLRAAATLSFSKFLCVSARFCEDNHALLFKILETSKDPEIRSNIVIALGDVAVSFSSIVDENSHELYKGLSDRNLVVKKNTLMVLTHLILNGMIKVKGQLGEMAKCLEDDERRISDLAKLFFTQLATKENAIYNNLPDVISHLSIGEHAVDEEVFQSTMKYIFQFIEKEKQAEAIVDKLCQRFRLSEEPRQWRDIAFCLSLLPFKSERSVKKLIEGLQFYRDKLCEPTVYEKFQEILTKARQNKSQNKPDTELNEFEAILAEHKLQGEEDSALVKRAEGRKAVAKKRATRKGHKKAPSVVDEEEDD